MGHFNKNNGNREFGGPRPLPESFNKGEIIDGLVFSTVPKPDGRGTHVAAVLTDGTHVTPGTYDDYRFVPVLDVKPYYCSVMGRGVACSALPVYYRELTREEWVREQKQRSQQIEDLIFDWSDERDTGRAPRLMSRSQGGQLVLVERGYEGRVQPGVVTRVTLVEARNGRNNALFAIPLAAPAPKPASVQRQGDEDELLPPVQPEDPFKVTLRSFERKPTVITVRSVADVTVRDRQMSIYDLLSDSRLGIRTMPGSMPHVIRENAHRIAKALEASLRKETPRVLRENTLARIDAIHEAKRRALAAVRKAVQDVPHQGEAVQADRPAAAPAVDGSKPKRRKKRNRRGHGRDGQNASAPVSGNAQRVQDPASSPNKVRPHGGATFGDAIGKALTKGVESAAPASPPANAVDPFDNGGDTDGSVDVPDSDDVIVKSNAPIPTAPADKFESAYPKMAAELSTTVEVLKAAIVQSGLDVVEFSEKPKNMKMFYVRKVSSEKSA